MEGEVSSAAYARYAACTGGLDDVERCYVNAWVWALELAGRLELDWRAPVVAALEARFRSLLA